MTVNRWYARSREKERESNSVAMRLSSIWTLDGVRRSIPLWFLLFRLSSRGDPCTEFFNFFHWLEVMDNSAPPLCRFPDRYAIVVAEKVLRSFAIHEGSVMDYKPNSLDLTVPIFSYFDNNTRIFIYIFPIYHSFYMHTVGIRIDCYPLPIYTHCASIL